MEAKFKIQTIPSALKRMKGSSRGRNEGTRGRAGRSRRKHVTGNVRVQEKVGLCFSQIIGQLSAVWRTNAEGNEKKREGELKE